MEKMEIISVRLPKYLKNKLNYASNTQGITKSDYIRNLIENGVNSGNTSSNKVLLFFLLGTTTILATMIIKSYLNRKKLQK